MDSVSSAPALDALALQLLEEKVSGPREWGVETEINPTLPLPPTPPIAPTPAQGKPSKWQGGCEAPLLA